MSYSYSMTAKAYGKIVLHCHKYPHLAVNGVVIGSIAKETQSVQIQDTVPLFHTGIGLAPMLQVALTQIEVYCDTKGLSIVGYYHANELLKDMSLSETAQSIASKIVQHCDKACLLLVENTKLATPKSNYASLKLYTKKDQATSWKEQTGNLKLQEGATSDAMRLVGNGFSDQLTDFDNHLDNVLLDWTNPDINQALSSGGN